MAERVRHSHSALKQFLECERAFYYRRILQLPEAPSPFLSLGGYVHAVVAAALRAPKVDYTGLLAQAKQSADWEQDRPDETLLTQTAALVDRLQAEVFPHLKPLFIERWSIQIAPTTAVYCAKIDLVSEWTPLAVDGRITGHIEAPCVIDWKTVFSGRRARSQDEVAGDAQLALYCLEADVRHAGVVELNLQNGSNRTLVTGFDGYQLQRWRRYFDAQFATMDDRGHEEVAYRLAAPTHVFCAPRWCPYWKHCPGGEGQTP